MRLIDADELKKKSRCIKIGENGRRSALLENWIVSELDINAMPTVDAVPIVHGHWIRLTDKNNPYSIVYGSVYQCSVCGELPMIRGCRTEYCEHCGAKMDGDTIDADELKKKSRSKLDINAIYIYAEWIEHERDATGRTFYKCSHCGTEYHSKKAAFCEDCGAVMKRW